jgi:hypothetical protein
VRECAPAVLAGPHQVLAALARAAALDREADPRDERGGRTLGPLDDVVLRPGPDRGERELVVVVAAEQDDRGAHAGVEQRRQAVEAVGVRQADVEQDAVGVALAQVGGGRREPLVAAHLHGARQGVGEDQRDEPRVGNAVLHHHDGRFGHGHAPPASSPERTARGSIASGAACLTSSPSPAAPPRWTSSTWRG